MKNTLIQIISFFALITLPTKLSACDGCACAANTSMAAGMPLQDNDFVGVKYALLSFSQPISDISFNMGEAVDRDLMQRIDLYGKLHLTERWKAMLFVPYQIHQRFYADKSVDEISGVGDISLLFDYEISEKRSELKDTTHFSFGHYFAIGAGVKLPSGPYRQRNRNLTLLPQNFQIGTGAYAFMLHSNYAFMKGNWGMVGNVFFQMGLTNESLYKFGNQWSKSIELYTNLSSSSFKFFPRIGFFYEHFLMDQSYESTMPFTGGLTVFGKMGISTVYKNWDLGVNYLVPGYYEFPSVEMKASTRISLSLIYLFGDEE